MENDRLSTTKLSSHLYHVIYMTCSMVDWKRYKRYNRHNYIRHLKNTVRLSRKPSHWNFNSPVTTTTTNEVEIFFFCLFILLLKKIGFPHWLIFFQVFCIFFPFKTLWKHLKHKSRKMFPQILIRFHKLCEINKFFLVFFTERHINGWVF